jgi:integrase
MKICNDFREYLLTVKRQRGIQSEQIAQSSARTYYNKFKAALKQAYRKELIEKDLSTRINSISETEVQREYLTLEQLQTLVKTPCSIPLLKNAAIFSALTGLRFCQFQNKHSNYWANAKNPPNEYLKV